MLLTAYNQDVQRYIEQPNTPAKRKIIAEIKEYALAEGINFNRLFPAGTKRYQVMDTIVYLLSAGGICKVESKTLAEKVGASVRTVNEAVKNIKELGLFIVGGLADGKNKYVFVYKNHTAYQEILGNVFYIDEIEANEALNADHNAEQIAEQENAESIDTKEAEGEKTSPIYYSFNISKQEKDIIRESIENDLSQSQNKEQKTQEYLNNPYQKTLYNYISTDNGLHPKIREKAFIIALRAGSNCTKNTYGIALKSVRQIDKALYMGTEIDSVPAVFTRIYTDRIKYSSYYDSKKTAPPKPKRDTSIYYNWLEDDKESNNRVEA